MFGTGINECSKREVCVQLELVGGMYRAEEKCRVCTREQRTDQYWL